MGKATVNCGDANENLVAKVAIVCYEGNSRSNGSGKSGYASVHRILDDGGGLRIGAGQPMRKGDLIRIAQNLMPEGSGMSGQFINSNVVYLGHDLVAWTVAAGVRKAHFRFAGERPVVVDVPYPDMVFIAKPNRLWVYSHKEKGRVGKDTELHWAVAMNIFSSALLCNGNIKSPNTARISDIPTWERLFFDSEFTHPNAGQDSQIRYAGGMKKMWESLHGARKFPLRYLKKVSKGLSQTVTLGDALKDLERV